MSTEPATLDAASSAPAGGWRHIFRPAPPRPVTITDPHLIKSAYASWQTRVLIFSILGYATFYLVRKNLGFAKLDMESKVGLDDKAFGIFLTLHGVLYGISKFANGFLSDRTNARTFMAVGLTLSALLNIIFGMSSGLWALGLIWLVNGWVQDMGYPPCARLISNWFPPKQLATKFSTWNASHCIGGAAIILLCSWLLTRHWAIQFDNWRLCFLVPASIALIVALVLWFNLPDTPPSVGLPELEGTETKSPALNHGLSFAHSFWKMFFVIAMSGWFRSLIFLSIRFVTPCSIGVPLFFAMPSTLISCIPPRCWWRSRHLVCLGPYSVAGLRIDFWADAQAALA